MTDVEFEPVRMRRRRLALQSTAPLPTVLQKLPQKRISNSTDKDHGLYSTLRIGALMYFSFSYLWIMCFPSVMEATLVFTSHTGDIIDALFHDWRGIRTRTDAATSPSIAKYGASTYCATETSPKKGSSNSTDKDYGLYSTLRIGALMNFSLSFLWIMFSLSNGSNSCLYNHTGDIIHVFFSWLTWDSKLYGCG